MVGGCCREAREEVTEARGSDAGEGKFMGLLKFA